MSNDNLEGKIIAHALYQIRILLSGYLGGQNEGPIEVRIAAHLSYALHNQALGVIDDKGFDVAEALARIERIDSFLNVKDGAALSNHIRSGNI